METDEQATEQTSGQQVDETERVQNAVNSATYFNQSTYQHPVIENGCVSRTEEGCKVIVSQWIFVVLGVLLIVTGFLMGMIYFSVRTLTTSLEHIETIPTYANCILLICSGIMVSFLYKRRDIPLVVTTAILGSVSLLLCTSSAVLMGTKSLAVMHNYQFCTHNAMTMQCHCYSYMERHEDATEYIYAEARNCQVIERNLLEFLYTLLVLFSIAAFLSAVSVGLAIYVIKKQRLLKDMEQESSSLNIAMERIAFSYCPGLENSDTHNDISQSDNDRSGLFLPRHITLPGIPTQLQSQSEGLSNSNRACLLQVHRYDNVSVPSPSDHQPRDVNDIHTELSLQEQTSSDVSPADNFQQLISQHNRQYNFTTLNLQRGLWNARRPQAEASNGSTLPCDILPNRNEHIHDTRSSNPTGPMDHLAYLHVTSGITSIIPLSCVTSGGGNNMEYQGYPHEPPPPYRPRELPPYVEDDQVPPYRTRENTPISGSLRSQTQNSRNLHAIFPLNQNSF